ncbi:MAG TPA: hypothetical protein VMT54_19815 [Candidatus Cybelea sp.]|nr:hypothetical protein [Candidatus Cybelea sp.]
MRRTTAAILLLLAGLPWHGTAQASGDFGCYPTWALTHHDLTGCDDMAMLSPGNDTRVNLMLLMMALRGKSSATAPDTDQTPALVDWATFGARFVPPPADSGDNGDSYAEGQGSRCLSDGAGTTAFQDAITAATAVPDAERTLLIDARRHLSPTCTGPSGGADGVTKAAGEVQSPLGKSFAAYLQGAQAFYDGDYDAAKSSFTSLGSADQPWLAETAHYMLARVEVNRAQVDAFDEYGTLKEGDAIDPKVIDGAEAALQAYLQAYPQGQYAASARGLLRRVYWIGGRTDKLAATYAPLLSADPTERGLNDVDLANEIDNKLLGDLKPQATTDPTLLAVVDLLHMRTADNEGDAGCCQPMPRTDLDAQKPSFASNPALFEFLQAAHAFYVENKPDEVVKLIPEAKPEQAFDALTFSRQMLRGMAMEALKDPMARDHWMAMLPGAVQPYQHPALELAIAYHDERDHGLDRVFATGSPVKNLTLREILLENTADAALLRRDATDPSVPQHERDDALFTLLYKEVTHGHYADFLKDLVLVPADAPTEASSDDDDPMHAPFFPVGVFNRTDNLGSYDCSPLKATALQLTKNAHSAKAQLCLADFMYANGFDQFILDTPPGETELGGTPSLFGGAPYSRLEVYKALIASAKTPAADKAYALFRAVNCYAPSGNNSCGGDEVPLAQRKAWFNQLKRSYPNSVWAKQLQYYW